ncbi:hypothetical protein PMAYCL1PPCAC_24921, partial [Pristionchus mayeri]
LKSIHIPIAAKFKDKLAELKCRQTDTYFCVEHIAKGLDTGALACSKPPIKRAKLIDNEHGKSDGSHERPENGRMETRMSEGFHLDGKWIDFPETSK